MKQKKIHSCIFLCGLLLLIIVGTGSLHCRSQYGKDPTKPLILFDHYHSLEEITTFLKSAAAKYDNLVTLVEIGRSRGNRSIYAIEINNPNTGLANEKPAFYLDGNIHGGEVLSGEGALYIINLLLEQYETDETIRSLVDTRVFYVVPVVNPDGREISIATPENHRRNIRPIDEDNDGKFDEDPPEDLDGDGRILQMLVENPDGRWKKSPEDPRLITRRNKKDSGDPYYQRLNEGIDNDGDGRYNEDPIGGVDINRNFPSNWHPGQYASGPYPLSEPESRALVEYITSRPNIAAVHTFHTSGGLILRFPTLADQDWDFPEADLKDYDVIARQGAEITGYDNYAFSKKAIVDLMNPGHGVFNDWASNVFGVLAMTTEMWKHPFGRGGSSLEWNDRVLDGKGYINWFSYQHPHLGRVELGGWDRWSVSNPPESMISDELKKNAQWVLSFAARLPRVTITDAQAKAVPGQQGLFKVMAHVVNLGWMPTATEYAAKVLRIAKPVIARVILENAELVNSTDLLRLGVLPGKREGNQKEVFPIHWQVKIVNPDEPAFAKIEVSSEKAGVTRQRVELPIRTTNYK